MAQNYIESGEILDFTATGAITSGSAVVIGAMVGVAMGTAATGEVVAVRFKGVFDLPKTTGQAHAIGAKLYWDAATSSLTTTVSTNTFAGYAWRAAISAATVTRIVLAQ